MVAPTSSSNSRSPFRPKAGQSEAGLVVAVVFVTLILGFFEVTGPTGWCRLTPQLWTHGYAWQLFTYPFVARDGHSIWLVLQLLAVYVLVRQVGRILGRRRLWGLLLAVPAAAGMVAAAVVLFSEAQPASLALMQGQSMLLTLLVTGYAASHGSDRMPFIPVRSYWLVVAVVGVLLVQAAEQPDVAGIIGRLVAVALSWCYVQPGTPGRILRAVGRRWRLARLRRNGLHVVHDEPKSDHWVN